MEGVCGVRRPINESPRECREGVFGNGTEFLESEVNLGAASMGKGVTDPSNPLRGFLTGDFASFFDGDVGDEGVANIELEEVALGEDEARSRVKVDGFGGMFSCGRSAMCRFGIGSVPE